MGNIGLLLTRIAGFLGKFFSKIVNSIGWGNIAGWTVAALIPAAYIAIWVGVLKYGFSAALTWFIGNAPDIFGGSEFPSGAMWLLNQTFPLSLMFSIVVSLMVFRVSAASLLTIAIAASRYLKGK